MTDAASNPPADEPSRSAPRPVALIDVVGLSSSLLGPHAPHLQRLVDRGRLVRLEPVLPAVTCSVQASMLTGLSVSGHGIVGNGWYDRESAEVRFWKQSNHLVRGEKVWETARRRDPRVTCAKMFWWFNMHSSADVSMTPRPIYRADGRKRPDVHAHPMALRDELQRELGTFPLFRFWGPAASIESSAWIAEATKRVVERHRPTITLSYLPHLDYPLQKVGPDDPSIPGEVAQVDAVVGDLVTFLEERGVVPVVVSEYGIEAVERPVFPNRILREQSLIQVRDECGGEEIVPGDCASLAVCDHQVAHVYVRDPAQVGAVRTMLESLDGVESVAPPDDAGACDRAGDLVLVAERGAWFAHDWWLEDAKAPDYQRTVDIHRKPGYDPRELFVDPGLGNPKLAIGHRLLRRTLGFRTLLDVISTDATLVKGSHGRVVQPAREQPVCIAPADLLPDGDDAALPVTAVRDLVLRGVFGART